MKLPWLSLALHRPATDHGAPFAGRRRAGSQKELMMHTHTHEEAGKASAQSKKIPELRAKIDPSRGAPGTKIHLQGEDVTTRIHSVTFLAPGYSREASIIHDSPGKAETTVPDDVPRGAVLNIMARDLNGNQYAMLGYFNVV
jgi:hypothetical protein